MPSIKALKQLSLDELMNVEVTSVSRRPEKLLDAPAAIQVVTGEDIRRSGASSIPEALRLAGSLDVAQENSHEWVVSARGFTSDVGNKLLVLMDGRTVYTPLFSGVFWDRQDTTLADIDRIEVVSGPGGSLWGANAVNGVINVVTKSAADTQGLLLEAGGGSGQHGFGGARYGGKLADNVSYRIYGKYFERDGGVLPSGRDAGDDWHMGQGGFRVDATPSTQDSLTLQGDLYHGHEGLATGGVGRVSGGNLLGRWSRTFSPTSDLSLQLYFDRTDLFLPVPAAALAPAGVLEDALDTYDLDFQHRFAWGERQQLIWGFGYRFTHDVLKNAPALAFFPARLDQDLFSGFAQDEIVLVPDRLRLTIGTKLEHNDYTGFEAEPNARLQWNPAPSHMFWAAVSRAVRTPSRIDRDISQPAPQYLIVILRGGRNFESETVRAWELGYRAQLGSRATASVSTFYNEYRDIRSTTISPPDPVFGLPFPFFFENNLEAETYGAEFNLGYKVSEKWILQAGGVFLEEDVRIKPGRMDFNRGLNETADPERQFSLRSAMDLPAGLELDVAYRWVDDRRMNNAGVAAMLPAYDQVDVRLGWRPNERVEFSLVGRNLLDRRHAEFGVPGPNRIEIERSVFAKATWRY